jgi:hypothetical protein
LRAVAHRLISDLDAEIRLRETERDEIPLLRQTLDARSVLSWVGHTVASVLESPELVDDTEMPPLLDWDDTNDDVVLADAAPGRMQLRVPRGPCRSPAWGFAKPGRQGWQRPG